MPCLRTASEATVGRQNVEELADMISLDGGWQAIEALAYRASIPSKVFAICSKRASVKGGLMS